MRFRPIHLLASSALVVLAGCFTGERPTFADPPIGGEPGTPTGDANVDAVLQRLETAGQATITANYTVTLAFGGRQTPAVVSQDAGRRSLTIGNVRYLWLGSNQTCDLTTGVCESGILDERVSDTGVTSGFLSEVPARRLRVAATKKTAPTTAAAESIAGNPATCVTVPLSAGSEQYCAGDYGIIARWIAADVTVELGSVTPAADEQYFTTVG